MIEFSQYQLSEQILMQNFSMSDISTMDNSRVSMSRQSHSPRPNERISSQSQIRAIQDYQRRFSRQIKMELSSFVARIQQKLRQSDQYVESQINKIRASDAQKNQAVHKNQCRNQYYEGGPLIDKFKAPQSYPKQLVNNWLIVQYSKRDPNQMLMTRKRSLSKERHQRYAQYQLQNLNQARNIINRNSLQKVKSATNLKSLENTQLIEINGMHFIKQKQVEK